MEVILLERVGRLGHMGDIVRVKDGFARNFLLPKGKALRATKENKAKYEGMKEVLETRNVEARGEAQKIGSGLDGKSFIVLRQASEGGQLYGSVSGRDVATILNEGGFKEVNRSHVALNAPIKNIGLHKVPVALHPEVEITVTINVARSADEAERIARGEDVIGRRDQAEEREALTASGFFDKPEEEEEGAAEPAEADEAKDTKETKGRKTAKAATDEAEEPAKGTKAKKAKAGTDDGKEAKPAKKPRKARGEEA
jgi:large subunit ribosomal protein L9